MNRRPTIRKGRLAGFSLFALVSILVTGMIWNTLQNNFARGSVRHFTAAFGDVAGLSVNDQVRIAGVRVGKVEEIELDGTTALVHFSVSDDQPVYATSTVAVRYQNLIGQRFVAVERPANATSTPQEPGQTIPRARTTDSLSLSKLLNGFQPVFQLLPAEQVNQLADSLIKAFEGQGPAMDAALEQITELAATFGERDAVFGAIVDNLTPVLTELADAGDSYRTVLRQAGVLVDGLVKERAAIGPALDGVADLVGAVHEVLVRTRVPGHRAILALNGAMTTFVPQADLLQQILKALPGFIEAFGRATGSGSWLNLYPCHLDGDVPGLVPPGSLSDFAGHSHTEVCR